MFRLLKKIPYGDSIRWYHGYYALAAINFLTMLAMLGLSHSILSLYSSAIQQDQEWSQRMARFYKLGELASAVSMPGNDVFRTRDVDNEAANLEQAVAHLRETLEETRSDVRRDLSEETAEPVLRRLAIFQRSVEKTNYEARDVLALFKKGDEMQAANRMAVMDRYNSEAAEELSETCEEIQRVRNQYLQADISTANILSWAEAGIATFVLCLIAGVTWLGSRIGRMAEDQERSLHCKSVDLKIAHEYLQENHRVLEEHAEELQAKTQSLEEAQVLAEQASLAKSQFLASMSHEIRTPLTAIIGYSEELSNAGKEGYDLQTIQSIRRNGRHLLEIINDILDLSKIEAGRFEVEHIATPLPRLIHEVVEMIEPRIVAKGLKFEVLARNPVPTQIFTDPTRLRQILLNLLGNSIKFTSAGTIRLQCGLIADTYGRTLVEFQVTDSGIGMNGEQIARLFQPFTQADQTMSRRFGGTGLGLAISKRLVEMLGGLISVQSVEAEGSTFTFTISPGNLEGVPQTMELGKTLPKPVAPAPVVIKVQGRVLFAEDGIDNQRLIGVILRKAGCEVTIVENGQQTLDAVHAAQAKGEAFDLILSDMMMPVMDGYTSVARLRSEGYKGPIVALTAHAMAGERERCLAVGCDDFATKPVNRQTLLETVRYHIELGQQTGTKSQELTAIGN